MHKMKFSIKSLTFSFLICALNLYFAPKLLRKANLALLEPQNVSPNAKSCSNVAEHNRDRSNEVKDEFYNQLQGILSRLRDHDTNILMGDDWIE